MIENIRVSSYQEIEQIYNRLKKSENPKIEYSCEKCGKLFTISIRAFMDRNNKALYCRSCKQSESLSSHIAEHKEEWVDRWKNAMIEHYGVDNAAHSPEIQEKKKETCLEKYGHEYQIGSEQTRKKLNNIFNERFGGNSPFCDKDVNNRAIETQKSHNNGKIFVNTPEGMEKARQNYFEKTGYYHNMENPESIEKLHNTIRQKYGSEFLFTSPEFLKKRKEVMLEKYGVEYYLQNPENRKLVFDKAMSSNNGKKIRLKGYRYNDVNFDSSYELAYYIYLQDNHIPFTFHPKKIFEYIGEDNALHLYYPDFEIDGKYYEIKGGMFFNDKDEPYNHLSKSFWWNKYNFLTKEGIVFLREKDLEPIFSYIKSTYGRDYLKGFRVKK